MTSALRIFGGNPIVDDDPVAWAVQVYDPDENRKRWEGPFDSEREAKRYYDQSFSTDIFKGRCTIDVVPIYPRSICDHFSTEIRDGIKYCRTCDARWEISPFTGDQMGPIVYT